jgi:hypothetical protein
LLLTTLAYPLMHGALIHATEQKHLGQPIVVRQAYLSALRHAGRLIGGWLLTGLLVSVMMASLISFPFALLEGGRWLFILTAVLALGLPFAFYLTIKWLLVLQTVMLEESRVTQSLARSSALVTGNWWRTLGVCILPAIAPTIVVGIPVLVALAFWGDPAGFVATVLQRVVSMSPTLVIVPLATIAQTLLYFDLRARRERYISQIMGGAVEVPPPLRPEYAPQVPNMQARQPRRLKLKPALVVATAVVVVLVAAITPTVLVLHNRADSSDIRVFVKSLSTGKEVRLGHGKLKTFDPAIAFIVEFDGSVQAGEQENTVEIVGSGEGWSDGLARVRVYAADQSAAEYYAPVQYGNYLPPEFYPDNEQIITVEVLDEHQVLVSSATGNFPAASQLALVLDYNGDEYSGAVARLFTG